MQTSQDIWEYSQHHWTAMLFQLDIVPSVLNTTRPKCHGDFSFSLDFTYEIINLSLLQSVVVNSQISFLWVTLKSHITSSTDHRNKLNSKPFQVFENHFTIDEANKFQKDPRTEILGYKIFKGHCKLRACFLSWGNIFFLGGGSWAFFLWQCVFLCFSYFILLKEIKSAGMLMWAAIKVAWLEGETTEQKTSLMKNMDIERLASLGTRQILEKHSWPLWHADRVPRNWRHPEIKLTAKKKVI